MSASGETAGRDLEIPLPPRRRVFVRLEELPDPDGDPRGRRVLLAPPSAYVVKLCQKMDQAEPNTPEHVAALYDVAAAMMPDLSRDEVDRISAVAVYQVIGTFNTPLEELERIAKNGASPLAKAGKGSRSRTPSSTRSPE